MFGDYRYPQSVGGVEGGGVFSGLPWLQSGNYKVSLHFPEVHSEEVE